MCEGNLKQGYRKSCFTDEKCFFHAQNHLNLLPDKELFIGKVARKVGEGVNFTDEIQIKWGSLLRAIHHSVTFKDLHRLSRLIQLILIAMFVHYF